MDITAEKCSLICGVKGGGETENNHDLKCWIIIPNML